MCKRTGHSLVYRGLQFWVLDGFEIPERNSKPFEEMENAVKKEVDSYLDKGTPIHIVGFEVTEITKEKG